MATDFKITAAARTLSLKRVYRMGEAKAYALFRKLRWPETNGAPVCPRCGCEEAYEIKTRRKFKCRSPACYHQYSVTSGTIFASRKLSFTDMLAAIAILSNAAKGLSAMQLSRDLDVQHKTAWVLCHKLREAMAFETAGHTLEGTVEVDGMHTGGYIKQANRVKFRVDRRLAKFQTGKRRVVIAMRQRDGRTLTSVVKQEADGITIINERVRKNSNIMADEATHWDGLYGNFYVRRINHTEAYSENGISTNLVESFFSRLRRMIRGQHHYVSPQYLHQYASHAAWIEDWRKLDNGATTKRIIGLAMKHPVSRVWKGYWQRTDRT